MRAALNNSTTVDNLQSRSRVHHFAVWIPNDALPSGQDASPQFQTVTYPISDAPIANGVRRTFAILAMTGRNPYRLESPLENFKSVMGEHWWDWLLPFNHSPCTNHIGFGPSKLEEGLTEPMYKFGPEIDKLVQEAGLSARSEFTVSTDKYGRRQLRQMHAPGR